MALHRTIFGLASGENSIDGSIAWLIRQSSSCCLERANRIALRYTFPFTRCTESRLHADQAKNDEAPQDLVFAG
jgi:hypothetical protein